MAKKNPGAFNNWKGTYYRGSTDNCPTDHLADGLNLSFAPNGSIQSREGTVPWSSFTPVRMALYKPNPPFTATNCPRPIILLPDGRLYDSLYPNTPLVGANAIWKDFGLVNFFGRCYITPSDGRVGVQNEFIYVYDGSLGPVANSFRRAAGSPPSVALSGAFAPTFAGIGKSNAGTYLFSYAYETASGFITQPAPFLAIDSFGGGQFNLTNIGIGPSGTVARWIITCKVIAFRANLTIPFDVTTAPNFPQYFLTRIADNVTTLYTANFYDEDLVSSADSLFDNLPQLFAGVGLIDFKGRMVSYGEYGDPSLVRVSEPGNPEQFSASSGFIITDPADSTGVRCATEFRNTIYIFKQQRGYMGQDNGQESSTWNMVNFEKAIGTEQCGIAALLDAKGSTSEGFLVADRQGLKFFNGTFQEPELSYKIIDYWKRINYQAFYLVQVAVDPINKRIYVIIPLDGATTPSHLLVADFRDGLDPENIKWCPWRIDPTNNAPNSILIYNDFSSGNPVLVTRMSSLSQIMQLNVGQWGPQDDHLANIQLLAEFPPTRYFGTGGVSVFSNLNLRMYGKGTINLTAYSQDKSYSFPLNNLNLNDETPGREYSTPMNLVSEQCRLLLQCNIAKGYFALNNVVIEGAPLWKMRPR